jgi:hypothetical protein
MREKRETNNTNGEEEVLIEEGLFRVKQAFRLIFVTCAARANGSVRI